MISIPYLDIFDMETSLPHDALPLWATIYKWVRYFVLFLPYLVLLRPNKKGKTTPISLLRTFLGISLSTSIPFIIMSLYYHEFGKFFNEGFLVFWGIPACIILIKICITMRKNKKRKSPATAQ